MITKQEFFKIIEGLKASYPNFKIIETKEAAELWYKLLSDIDYNSLSRAITEHISTCQYPPSIAEIRQKALANTLIQGDWSSGWDLVKKSISKYGFYKALEGLEYIKKQDQIAYEAIKTIGYTKVCMSENTDYDRANFRMIYEAKQDKINKIKVLPESVRKELQLEDKESENAKITTLTKGLVKRLEG